MKELHYDELDPNANDVVHESLTFMEILNRINLFKIKTFYIVDDQKRLIGVITDGDIRRGILKGKIATDSLDQFMNQHPKRYFVNELGKLAIPKLLNAITRLPVVNEKNILLGFFPKAVNHSEISSKNSALAIAPTRISFAGGGSDINYWFNENEGCVVNAAVQKYARVSISRNFSDVVNIRSLNTNEKLTINVNELKLYNALNLNLIVQSLNACGVKDGLDINIFCDYQPGTGLGGSSSVVVATLLGISKIYNFQLSTRDLVHLSYHVERELSGIKGGWQDQIISSHGGLCITRFGEGNHRTFKLSFSKQNTDILNSQLFLSPVGANRESSEVHEMQQIASKRDTYAEKMHSIVSLANTCAEYLGQGKIAELGQILHKGWVLKKELGSFISNSEIDQRYNQLIDFGAQGGRLLGAGMSGYLMVMVKPENQLSFLKACGDQNIPLERISLDLEGARVV